MSDFCSTSVKLLGLEIKISLVSAKDVNENINSLSRRAHRIFHKGGRWSDQEAIYNL